MKARRRHELPLFVLLASACATYDPGDLVGGAHAGSGGGAVSTGGGLGAGGGPSGGLGGSFFAGSGGMPPAPDAGAGGELGDAGGSSVLGGAPTGAGGALDAAGAAGMIDAGGAPTADAGSAGALGESGAGGVLSEEGGAGGRMGGGEAGAVLQGGVAGQPQGGVGGQSSAGGGAGGAAGAGQGCAAATVEGVPPGSVSSGQPALADSELAGSPAADANDDDVITKWKAADTLPGHWWRVDLGASYELSGVRIVWEFQTGRQYGVEIDVSDDDVAYIDNVLTETMPGGVQSRNITGQGRYVRVTVTSITPTTDSASIKEFNVCGE